MLEKDRFSNGSIAIWLAVFVVVVVWGMLTLANRMGGSSLDSDENITQPKTETTENINENEIITKSLVSVNDYSTARGKVIIEKDAFGYFNLKLSAAMPSEFPGTNYFARVEGANGKGNVEIGKLDKDGGAYTGYFEPDGPIQDYSRVVIYVDGAALTVENKPLPHNVMVLDL